jgi:hypothetical protein
VLRKGSAGAAAESGPWGKRQCVSIIARRSSEGERDVQEPESHWNRWKGKIYPLDAFSVLFLTVKSEYIINFEIFEICIFRAAMKHGSAEIK